MYLLFYGVGPNDFEAGNIYYKGHWKGWALKIETFLAPEMATSVASAIWAQKSARNKDCLNNVFSFPSCFDCAFKIHV
jgi:hypothetical protein